MRVRAPFLLALGIALGSLLSFPVLAQVTISPGSSSGGSAPFSDATALVKDDVDATKLFTIDATGITTGNNPVMTLSGTAAAPVWTATGWTINVAGGALKLANEILFASGDAGIMRVGSATVRITNGPTNVDAGLYVRRVVSAQTGAYSPGNNAGNAIFTNTGDTDGTTATLYNDPTAGHSYSFATTVAQVITIVPSAGETLYFGTDQCVASITSSAAIGNAITIAAASGGAGAAWMTLSSIGSWTCNDI